MSPSCDADSDCMAVVCQAGNILLGSGQPASRGRIRNSEKISYNFLIHYQMVLNKRKCFSVWALGGSVSIMAETELTIAAAFMIGLFGSVHCIGMCGGIVNTLGLAVSPQAAQAHNLLMILWYNLGRIASYTVFGAIVGGVGMFAQENLTVLQPIMRVLAGAMVIAMGLYLAGWWRGLVHVERLGNQLIWSRVQPILGRFVPVNNSRHALFLGGLWGCLPCGLVYSSLALAATLADWRQSAVLMAAFGFGTLPVMLLTGLMAKRLRQQLQKSAVRNSVAVLVLAFGLWTVLATVLFHGHHGENHGKEHNGPTHHHGLLWQGWQDQTVLRA